MNFIKDKIDYSLVEHPIISNLAINSVVGIAGFNAGFHLTKGNRLFKEINGLGLSLGLGLLCNTGLFIYQKYYLDRETIEELLNKENQDESETPVNLEDQAELLATAIGLTDKLI